MTTLSHHLLTEAYNNAWADHRLLEACAQLSQEEFEAPRTGFFPSIRATLNHILTVDWFYIDALEREMRGAEPHPNYLSFFERDQPCGTCAELRAAQKDADRRLIEYCQQLKDDELGRVVTILRIGSVQRDKRYRLLAHVFGTRPTIADRCTPCCPAPAWRRRSWTSFSALGKRTCANRISRNWAGPRK